HKGPHKTAAFACGIGFLLAIELQPAALGLAGLIKDVALNVELPAVIETAQAALFVAPEGKRGAAVQTALAENAQASLGVAEDDEVFAQHARPDGCAAGLGHFLGQAGRQPMAPHDLAHRPVAFDAGEEIVVFPADHFVLAQQPGYSLASPLAKGVRGRQKPDIGAILQRNLEPAGSRQPLRKDPDSCARLSPLSYFWEARSGLCTPSPSNCSRPPSTTSRLRLRRSRSHVARWSINTSGESRRTTNAARH